MSNYLSANKMMNLTLVQIEKTLENYLKIAEASGWNISKDFQKDLEMLTLLAKEKGSTKRW